MRITMLGSGTSGGVPQLDTGWGVCNPDNPKNKRLRASILIETKEKKKLLVDCGPDFRQQALRHNIRELDSLIWTHAHADHCHGIDELRWICCAMKAPISGYSFKETLEELQERFGYCFTPITGSVYYKPVIKTHVVEPGERYKLSGEEFLFFKQDHGFSLTLGLRVGNFAYSTDVIDFPKESEPFLYDLDLWIVDCLQPLPHKTHAWLERTLAWIEKFKPKRAILTHMNNKMDYDTICALLPANVLLGYDGLTIDL